MRRWMPAISTPTVSSTVPSSTASAGAPLQDRQRRPDLCGADGLLFAQGEIAGRAAARCARRHQNDPSNGNRALLLLQKEGLIKLRAGAGTGGRNATPLDVVDNPKRLKLVELDSAILPRALADLDAASINTDYAVKAGLSPARDAIATEDLRGPYANLIAVREQDRTNPGSSRWWRPTSRRRCATSRPGSSTARSCRPSEGAGPAPVASCGAMRAAAGRRRRSSAALTPSALPRRSAAGRCPRTAPRPR